MESDLPDKVDVDPSMNQEITMEETHESQEQPNDQEQTHESHEKTPEETTEPQEPETNQESQEPEPMEEETVTQEDETAQENVPSQDEPEQMEVEKDTNESPKEQATKDEADASWQIPVAALRQPQHQSDLFSNKANARKEKLESRLKENQYDIDAWTTLINDAQHTGDLDIIRDIYERFLKVFPTSVSFHLIREYS
jgi:cleavage stimulation factor subunit 3